MQALPVNLARRGFVVFQYDMVGYADSTALSHRTGFGDAAAELRLLSPAGLQTWNSVRALDFVCGLPDVDAGKIGVTGASGGGTQTFLLCAVDDRPSAAVPAVMVSTAMQGGCVCENASHLRVGAGNVELAALHAPKPLGLTAADDWTKELATKGFPELKRLYALLGADGKLAMHYKPHPHNYDKHSREFMTNFFRAHLLGQPEPVAEEPFEPIPVQQLSVFDAGHPRLADLLVARLRDAMAAASDKQLEALKPGSDEFRRVVGTALRVLVHDELPPPKPGQVSVDGFGSKAGPGGVTVHTATLGRGDGQAVNGVGLIPEGFGDVGKKVVVWADMQSTAWLTRGDAWPPGVAELLAKRFAVFALDLFQPPKGLDATKPSSNQVSGAFLFGYNRGVFAERVRDVLTGIVNLRDNAGCKDIRLCGWGWAGPVALTAAALAGKAVTRVAADLDGFRFEAITDLNDPMLLPGAVKYGGLPAFAALLAPTPLLVHNHRATGAGKLLPTAYAAAGAEDKLTRSPDRLDPAKVAGWLAG
jgi:dienelactone hydrolase